MIIDAPCGSIEGLVREGFLLFKGIPYAQPPVGALRFSPPQQMEPWNGVYKATEFGPICPQDSHEPGSFYHKEFYSGEAPRMDEDCLYLNILTPKQWREPLPVAIWFHGGAYLNGHGAEMEFDGEAYAKRGVILVTVNYRLGFFGFFAHPKLKHSGNYGILDQIAAIDWVRENIGAFGGDTDNITVFVQSAGGGSVQTLVRSALTEGKVHKAIIQSAGGYKDWCVQKLGIPAITVEVGNDKYSHPYPYHQIDDIVAKNLLVPQKMLNTISKEKQNAKQVYESGY